MKMKFGQYIEGLRIALAKEKLFHIKKRIEDDYK